MKRLLLHIVTLLSVSLSSAQILAPMGAGLPAAPQKIAAHGTGVVVAYSTSFDDIELQVWNGDFWYKIDRPSVDKTSESYKIIDLISFENNVYLATGKLDDRSSKINHISKWDGTNWTTYTSSLIANSTSIDRLFIEDGYLKCIGRFKSGTDNFNIIKLDGTWKTEGNLITKNLIIDRFSGIAKSGDKLYATGNFTDPTDPKLSLAIWDGTTWSVANNPPFLEKNIAIGNYKDKVVVYGKSNFVTAPIKVSFGGVWQDMSSGLEQYTVANVSQFAEVGSNLYAVGSFIKKNTNETVNLMMYNGEQWTDTKIALSDIEQLYSNGTEVIISGDFSDNSRLNGIGTIQTEKAQITARVYHDKNANCTKESDEDWLSNYPVILKDEAIILPTDYTGQVYLQVNKEKHTLNAATHSYYIPTCPDAEIDVDEHKTYYGTALGVNQQADISDAAIYVSDLQGNNTQIDEVKRAQVCIENLGGTSINNATVSMAFIGEISDFTSEEPLVSFIDNTATWRVDVSGNSSTCFGISYKVKSEETLELTGTIALQAGTPDANLKNNSTSLKYKKGDTEGNTKYCYNGETIGLETESMKYKVSFRNNGPSTAHSVIVVDELDPTLAYMVRGKIHTITSHLENVPKSTVEIVYTPDGRATYKIITHFDAIYLTTAEQNKDDSEGFADYEILINPNNLKTGTELCNTAKIYYSYREGSFYEPITTNEVCSQVGVTAGIVNSDNNGLLTFSKDLAIGPNPVENYIYIKNSSAKRYTLNLVNALGQSITSTSISPLLETKVDVRLLDAGVYFIYADGIFAQKFVIY